VAGLFSNIVKPSADPKWPDTLSFKIRNGGCLIEGGTTIQDSKGRWKIDTIKWKESTTTPVQVVMDSGKAYDAPRVYMSIPGDDSKYTEKIIVKNAAGENVKRFVNWGDVRRGSEIQIQFKFGKIWKSPMGLTVSLDIVQALIDPPQIKSTTAFAGKRCVEPTDEELLAISEGGTEGAQEAQPSPPPASGGGYVPTFDEEEVEKNEVVEAESKEFSSPVKESVATAPSAPKKKRKTAEE